MTNLNANPDWLALISLISTVFLVSAIEAIEATGYVLVIGRLAGYRMAVMGAGLAVAVLITLLGGLGTSLLYIVPFSILKVVAGVSAIFFGVKWLDEALLRKLGHLPLRGDEAQLYQARLGLVPVSQLVLPAFITFKAVLMEGLEIVLVVMVMGMPHPAEGGIWLAALTALVAVGLVAALGFALRRPLSNIPANTLKLVIGIMLCSCGVYWFGNGIGITWWRENISLFGLGLFFSLVSLFALKVLPKLELNLLNREGKQKGRTSKSGQINNETTTLTLAAAQTQPSTLTGPSTGTHQFLALLDHRSYLRQLLGLFLADRVLLGGISIVLFVSWFYEQGQVSFEQTQSEGNQLVAKANFSTWDGLLYNWFYGPVSFLVGGVSLVLVAALFCNYYLSKLRPKPALVPISNPVSASASLPDPGFTTSQEQVRL